jgi:hypothetical protein
MALLRRTPSEVRALVPPGERLLAWSRVSPAGVAVVTDAALYLPVPQTMRFAWDLVAKATFEETGILVVEGRDQPTGPDRAWRVLLDEPGAFPTVVYERVTSSVVVSERVVIEGDLGARVVARRVGDRLRWTVTFDGGLDPRDPQVRARADVAIAELRSALGV